MSNLQVGSVYQTIIEEVIEGCNVTFEEEGVSKLLLEDLKKTWQQKLSDRHVALMPWDPAPPMANNSTASAPSSAPAPAAVKPEPAIKTEPPSYPEYSSTSNQPSARGAVMPTSYDSATAAAQARAAQNLQNKFGDSAKPQVTQLQAQAQLGQTASASASAAAAAAAALQGHAAEMRQQQYQQQLAHSIKQQQQQQQQRANNNLQALPTPPHPQPRASVGAAQTDGAGDWDATLARRQAVDGASTAQADRTLKQRVTRLASEMEGGGLMRPSSERKCRAEKVPGAYVAAQKATASASGGVVPQYDGGDDEDVKAELDDDAINSDLDDPDDDAIEETEEDGNVGEIMLCTYDKVQRVKNKWKCTLKDGVLTTGGKEYLFGKGQGEFEW